MSSEEVERDDEEEGRIVSSISGENGIGEGDGQEGNLMKGKLMSTISGRAREFIGSDPRMIWWYQRRSIAETRHKVSLLVFIIAMEEEEEREGEYIEIEKVWYIKKPWESWEIGVVVEMKEDGIK